MLGAALVVGAAAFFVAPADLGKHWLWPLTPLLCRVVAGWYALFGTMLLSCAVGLRRPAEAIIAYATLAAWSVLLLALPLLHPDNVSSGGPWIALMFVLLGLSAYALRLALPDRGRLYWRSRLRRECGPRACGSCTRRAHGWLHRPHALSRPTDTGLSEHRVRRSPPGWRVSRARVSEPGGRRGRDAPAASSHSRLPRR